MSKSPGSSSKRARAAERNAFVAARAGDYDRNALADAMAERMAAELAAGEAALAAAAAAAAESAGEPAAGEPAAVAEPVEAVAGQPADLVAAAVADAGVAADAVPEAVPFDGGVALPRIVAANNTRRWVPIGPSVIRAFGQDNYTRSTGRVRDLAVSDDGKRAYAATAKGGLWYSDDGGQFWQPVGGWAERAAVRGGVNSAQSCGCLLVKFGATAADDFVMVGTGELQGFSRAPIRPALAGLGVLSAKGPVSFAGGADPWEPQAGIAQFEGLGIFELARDPASTAGKNAAPNLDRVLAGTSAGLFLGTRRPAGPAPHTGEFTWTLLDRLGRPFMGMAVGRQPLVTDVLWLARGADPNGRIVVAVALGLETADAPAPVGSGVAYSDDLGVTWHWVTNLNPTAAGADKGIGRMSFANPENDRVYVLGERHQNAPPLNIQTLWRVAAMNAATPTAETVGGMPVLWTGNASTGKNQRDYDQCIAVEVVGGNDRVYLGGNYHSLTGVGSVYCFEVQMPARTLAPATGISRTGAPPAGDGAMVDGLIGDDIHPDVHNIRLPGPPGATRQVWIATDGGIYVSNRAGRVKTFDSRAAGLAAAEVQFHAPHPTSTHFGALGCQDNGRQIRIGDVVWEDVMSGDGGGAVFHPIRTDVAVLQYTYHMWDSTLGTRFADPLTQGVGSDPDAERERLLTAFFSGASTVKQAGIGRLALGTNRVWISDDLGSLPRNSWNVLPFAAAAAAASNPRTAGTDPPANQRVGVPGGPPFGAVAANGRGPFGSILTVKWVHDRALLVLFAKGVIRWTQDSVTLDWTSQVLIGPAAVPGITGAPNPSATLLSDLAPIPGTDDFYLVTTGVAGNAAAETCLHFHNATSTFRRTGLRGQLAPLNPAYAAIVDPAVTTDVYVGTATGVWRGVRGAGPPANAGDPWPHTWTPEVNGTPQNVVQDLSIWHDPAVAGGPRLLRAAMQSRGVWELDLQAATEPQRTYVRVHAADDRRRLPTPMANPRQPPAGPQFPSYASPDIVVRPRPSPTTAPTWRLVGPAVISRLNPVEFELWTFQTAFRWIYPSVQANGLWSRALSRLIELHRDVAAIGPVRPEIDSALWEAVVEGTTVSATGVTTTRGTRFVGAGHAVYRPPWQTPANMAAVATEIDLIDHVRQVNPGGVIQQVYREPCTVDVLIHHRDTRPLAANDAFAILMWREDASEPALRGLDVGATRTYAVAAAGGGPAPAAPAGWNVVMNGPSPLHRLPVPLDARMPRAVSIDVDFTAVPVNHHVLLMAFVGSSIDPCSAAPVALPASPVPADITRRWPHAAVRIIQMTDR